MWLFVSVGFVSGVFFCNVLASIFIISYALKMLYSCLWNYVLCAFYFTYFLCATYFPHVCVFILFFYILIFFFFCFPRILFQWVDSRFCAAAFPSLNRYCIFLCLFSSFSSLFSLSFNRLLFSLCLFFFSLIFLFLYSLVFFCMCSFPRSACLNYVLLLFRVFLFDLFLFSLCLLLFRHLVILLFSRCSVAFLFLH